jgi:hypothetical protein
MSAPTTDGAGVGRELDARQRDVLSALAAGGYATCAGSIEPIWVTPMMVGGRDASHHSRTLARLASLGLAERRQRGGWARQSYVYRITDAGRVLLRPALAPAAPTPEGDR